MTIKMIALKRVYYPRGMPTVKEHQPGETFEVLSERDAKALRLMKIAADAAPENKDMTAETPRRKYQRRDMTPEE